MISFHHCKVSDLQGDQFWYNFNNKLQSVQRLNAIGYVKHKCIGLGTFLNMLVPEMTPIHYGLTSWRIVPISALLHQNIALTDY